MQPRVFISHASEDKERFVLAFAERLRAAGVDAWLDRWEMLPGDSLVDKIFEEGLRNAAAVVVVLSKYSANKPWVREELNAAFVKRVNAGSKLIPVLIDDCTVPEALQSTVWERIADVDSYDRSFERIVGAITGIRDKPALGTLPAYATSPVQDIGGLAEIDNLVLKAASEIALQQGHDVIDATALQAVPELHGVPEQELDDSLEVLDRFGMIRISRHLGPGLPRFRIATYGFQRYAQAYIPNYERIVRNVALAIVNHQMNDSEAIARDLELAQFMVDHALDVLEQQGHVTVSREIGGRIYVVRVSPALRRVLSE